MQYYEVLIRRGLMAEAEITAGGPTDASTAVTRRVTTLDGVRALAALGVLVFHCAEGSGFSKADHGNLNFILAILKNLGNFGVAVFFVLSGYLLFREFVRKILFDGSRTPLPHYFERRFLRIYPAYWVALVGFVLVAGAPSVVGSEFGLLTLTERQFSSKLFPGLGVAWTLYIEVAFYVFLPIYAGALALACRNRNVKTRLVLVISSLACLVAIAHFWIGVVVPFGGAELMLRLRMNLPTYLGWFAGGMALSVASVWTSADRSLPRMLRQLVDRAWICWAIAFLAYVTVVLVDTNIRFAESLERESALMFQTRIFLQGIAALFFVLPMALGDRPSHLRSIVGNRYLAWIGGVSYGVYLWHTIIVRQVNEWATIQPDFAGFLWMLAIVMPSAILVGWISFRLIEKPALSLAR